MDSQGDQDEVMLTFHDFGVALLSVEFLFSQSTHSSSVSSPATTKYSCKKYRFPSVLSISDVICLGMFWGSGMDIKVGYSLGLFSYLNLIRWKAQLSVPPL